MLDLLLNVVFASSFGLIMKWVQVRGREDVVSVGAVNYIVAALLIVPGFLGNDVPALSTSAAVSGGVMGACYFAAYFFMIYTVRWMGVAASTVIAVLSILFPIACGVFIWNEQPNAAQVAGIVFALIALALMGGRRGATTLEPRPWFAPLVSITFFLLAGSSRVAQEAFKHTSQADQRPTFLMAAFLVAAAMSLVVLVQRGRSLSTTEVAMGIFMGTVNIVQAHFLLRALQHFDGFIVFPVTSAGAIILTTVVATRFLGEHLSRRTYGGITIAVVALVLLNWVPAGY